MEYSRLQSAFPSPFKSLKLRTRLTDEMAQEVAAALTDHASSVNEVKLLIGSLTVDSPGTRALCASFKLLRKLRLLSLTNEAGARCRLQSNEVAKALLSSACRKIHLVVLLSHLHVDEELLSRLSRHVTLRLNLFGCTIDNISANLSLRNRTLQNLLLVGVDFDMQPTLLTNLLVGLRGNKALKSLALINCTITNVSGIAGYVKENRSLTSLNLQCSQSLRSGWEVLRAVLVERKTPLDLDLSGVRLGDENFGILVSAVEANARVNSLVLCDRGFDRLESLTRLFRTLRSNPHMSELMLSAYSRDSEPILEALFDELPSFCALRKLKVDGDADWQGWTDRLLKAMERNGSLFELQLENIDLVSSLKCHHRPFRYYGLRNQVNASMQSLPKMLWPSLIARLSRWEDLPIGLSNLSLLLKTRPDVVDNAVWNKKKRNATEEDRESM